MLRPFIRKFTKSPADAEDVVQEVFLKVWLSRDRLIEIVNVQAWIFSIAGSTCADYLRKHLSYQRRLDGYEQAVSAKDEKNTPLETLHFEEMHSFIGSVVEKMPPQRKRIFLLSRIEGKKPAEIADILSISVGTVKNILTTGVKQIREALEKAGYSTTLVFYLIIKLF